MAARLINRLPAFLNEKERAAAKAVTQATMLVTTEASYLTPIKSGDLLRSQYRELSKEGGKIRGVIGYSITYAAYVHDPNVKQNFTRDSAEKEFLLKGANRAKPMIDKIIKGALKV